MFVELTKCSVVLNLKLDPFVLRDKLHHGHFTGQP